MPKEHPFLIQPQQEQQASGAVPAALFDLAVNRAAATVRKTGNAEALAAWHARTRFARRVSLERIRQALAQKPKQGEWHWAGGPHGGWQEGKALFP